MRLFIAVDLDDAVRRHAGRLAERLARDLEPGARRAISWVSPRNMHLTLRFLGEVEPAAAAEVVGCLSGPLATPAFRVTTGGVGAFPPSGPPRVIWLGFSSGAEELSALQREIEARLGGHGLPREERPFRAHLTLGRVKGVVGVRARDVLAALVPSPVAECAVDHVTLYESHLSPKGPTYTALARSGLPAVRG